MLMHILHVEEEFVEDKSQCDSAFIAEYIFWNGELSLKSFCMQEMQSAYCVKGEEENKTHSSRRLSTALTSHRPLSCVNEKEAREF